MKFTFLPEEVRETGEKAFLRQDGNMTILSHFEFSSDLCLLLCSVGFDLSCDVPLGFDHEYDVPLGFDQECDVPLAFDQECDVPLDQNCDVPLGVFSENIAAYSRGFLAPYKDYPAAKVV